MKNLLISLDIEQIEKFNEISHYKTVISRAPRFYIQISARNPSDCTQHLMQIEEKINFKNLSVRGDISIAESILCRSVGDRFLECALRLH